MEGEGEERGRRGIIVYIEYHTVCPSKELGLPTPYPARECVFLSWTQKGEASSLADELGVQSKMRVL
jgi:hypothetical protein